MQRLLRILVPLFAIGIGIAVAISIAQNNPNAQKAEQEAQTQQQTAPPGSTPGTAPESVPGNDDAKATDSAAPTDAPPATANAVEAPAQTPAGDLTLVADLGELSVAPAGAAELRSLGSTDPADGYRMKVDLALYGAGVDCITLADYLEHVDESDKYVLLKAPALPLPAGAPEDTRTPPYFYPFAARSLTVNGELVSLSDKKWNLEPVVKSENTESVRCTITINDSEGGPVADVVREYVLTKGSYDLQLRQYVVNRTDKPLHVIFNTYIQGDLTSDGSAYLGDRRQFVTAYFDNGYAPNHQVIFTARGFVGRSTVLKDLMIWPNSSVGGATELAWLASENRYFNAITHCPVPDKATSTSQVPALQTTFPTVGVEAYPSNEAPESHLVFSLATSTIPIAPGGQADLSLAVYAGPRDKAVFSQFPYNLMNFAELIRYELGCTFCTFQWLAKFLLAFLTFLHTIFHDWGVAIIILVVIVRLLLHPLTKKAQINMMKMGKQMQAIQPEMEKLREKYKDDQQSLNAEMMKLYREKGVNPANMLGCLPMFLQMPIWVALYAMLYLAIQLRHQPAFYNVFHNISTWFGGDWQFLTDLSSPDRFLVFFDKPHVVSLLLIQFNAQSLNILPILMAAFFFFQQKFTTPPPANDQAKQQQRIMQVMVVLLFPVMLYSAPSGLTLYILASTGIGVFDSWIVRRHVRELEESGKLFEKKEHKPGGFVDRLQKAVAAKQNQVQQQTGQGSNPYKKRNKRK